MAKREEFKNQKSKVTVMMFQLEGTDETLQEGIRTIGHAIGTVLKPVRVIPAKTTEGNGHDTMQVLEETTEVEPEENSTEAATTPRRDAKPTKSRSPRILDLPMKSAKINLAEFCAQKKVSESDSERYLVIAYWLKDQLNISDVTMDHIHTCYRTLNWQTPSDASAPLRSGKVQGWFNKGEGKGAYSINHVGENKVMACGGR